MTGCGKCGRRILDVESTWSSASFGSLVSVHDYPPKVSRVRSIVFSEVIMRRPWVVMVLVLWAVVWLVFHLILLRSVGWLPWERYS